MNADSIVAMLLVLNHESALKPEDGEAVLLRYPYFEAGRFALLRKLREHGDYRFQEQLKQAAVHCSDRKALYLFVEREAGEMQKATSSLVIEEPLAASTADDQSVPETDSVQTSADRHKSEDIVVEQIKPELQETVMSSPQSPEALATNEAPVALSAPSVAYPENAKPAQAEQTPLTNAPTQRKPRINWNPDQAIEAPNDILSQILAYPELGKSETEKESAESPENKAPALTEFVEKKPAEEPRRFTEWLKATQAGTAQTGQTKPSVEKGLLNVQMEERTAPKASFFNPIEMARKSVEDRDDLVTETLAKVYLSQGDTARAIRIYHKLSLLYPEKSAYFAALVEKIVKPS